MKTVCLCFAIISGLSYLASPSFAIGPSRGMNPPFEKLAAGCKKELDTAQRKGVLREFDWRLPKEPHVVVGAKFLAEPLRARESLLASVNCYLNSGEIGQCLNFDVISWETNTPVGRFESCKFVPRRR